MVNQVRRNNLRRRDIEELGRSSEHGKVLQLFLHGRALVNPEIESKRMYMCVYVFFYSYSLFPSSRIHPRFSYSRRTRRGCFISTPVAIVPFVSQPALHASRRRAFPPTFSIYLLPTASLFLSPSLSPLLFMADPSGGRIDSTLSRRIREYAFNVRRRRIYSPAYFPHFDE